MQQYTFGYSKTAQNLAIELNKEQNKHLAKYVNKILADYKSNNYQIDRIDARFWSKSKIDLLSMNKDKYLKLAKDKLHDKSNNDFIYTATCYVITTSFKKYYNDIFKEKRTK